jgi:cytochrome c-type biogenesis protein CcmH
MHRKLYLLIAMMAFIPPFSSYASGPLLEPTLENPEQEKAAQSLFRQLRCVVCQGESLADSSADVARSMRQEIRTQIAAGKKGDEIIAYFTERYGNFVLLRPPLAAPTFLLWFGPALIVVIAITAVVCYFYRQKKS